MHELAIATSLVELANDHAVKNNAARVTDIYVRLGMLCSIARSLYFCFGAATRGTLCEGAKLHIEEVPLTIFCDHCGDKRSPLSLFNLRCPDCGMPTRKVLSGREMDLTHIELEAGDPAEMDRNLIRRHASNQQSNHREGDSQC